jgi:hypothetical protein
MGHTLEELMQGLPIRRQLEAAVHFAALGLPIWEEFAAQDALTYIDGVVGVQHTISATLPARVHAIAQRHLAGDPSLDSEEGQATLKVLKHEFIEPIVALQDDDWDLPEPVKLIFYAHSNLLEHLSGAVESVFGESLLYVTVNQAVDGIEKSGKMTMAQLREVLRPFSGGRAPA